MSRRDARDSDTRRHRSRFDQEPSPKRSRRDGKPETERTLGDDVLDERDHLSGDQKHRRRLQVAVPLEAPSKEVSKEEVLVTKESDKADANHEEQKLSSNPTEVPRSRSYFQHDERGSSGVAGRNFKHRTTVEGGWQRDPKERQIGGAKMLSSSSIQEKDGRVRTHERDNDTWRHDKYLDTEADPKPPARKRPSFREKKILDDSEKADKSVVEPVKANASEQPVVEIERRDERGNSRQLDRYERLAGNRAVDRYERPAGNREADRFERPAGNREANFGETRRGNFPPPRGRYSNRSGYNREREQFVGRQAYPPPGGRAEKWKHDLYDEANKSPSPKNEDDAIAKVEALLAS